MPAGHQSVGSGIFDNMPDPNSNRCPAIVLLSGGLDSATCLHLAARQGFDVTALSFRYGQRHDEELVRAKRLAAALPVRQHHVLTIDAAGMGGSALTNPTVDVPKNDSVDGIGKEIPVTYVPARNTIFLAHALAIAESIGCRDLFIGVNALDYSGYPDCRPEYIAAFERLANLATAAGIGGQRMTIHAPLIDLTKGQIIARGLAIGVDYSQTLSCYDPVNEGRGHDKRPCRRCDSCLLRAKGFAENGIEDPALAG